MTALSEWLLQSPRLRVCALLLAALAVVYANVVFGGRSLVASDNYNPMRPPVSAASYGPDFVPYDAWGVRGLHQYAGFYDPGAAWWIWEPSAHYFRRALAHGELPFWDPYVGAGAPAMANLNATHFFPPYLLMVLLGAGSLAKNVYMLGLLFGAGFFTYLFLRQHELSHAGAAFGGLAFTLSGVLTSRSSPSAARPRLARPSCSSSRAGSWSAPAPAGWRCCRPPTPRCRSPARPRSWC
jgi:hypothetical protein